MNKRFSVMLLLSMLLAPAVFADEAGVAVDAGVQAEEPGFFSRSWTGIKSLFGADDEARADESAAAKTDAELQTSAELDAQASEQDGDDGSVVDTAADKTKAGVDWTADKAKKGAEWTKETAKGATKATGKGIKKAGEAIEGLFPNSNDTTVDAEASADAEVESD